MQEIVETCSADVADTKRITLYGVKKLRIDGTDEEIAFAAEIEEENATINARDGLTGTVFFSDPRLTQKSPYDSDSF